MKKLLVAVAICCTGIGSAEASDFVRLQIQASGNCRDFARRYDREAGPLAREGWRIIRGEVGPFNFFGRNILDWRDEEFDEIFKAYKSCEGGRPYDEVRSLALKARREAEIRQQQADAASELRKRAEIETRRLEEVQREAEEKQKVAKRAAEEREKLESEQREQIERQKAVMILETAKLAAEKDRLRAAELKQLLQEEERLLTEAKKIAEAAAMERKALEDRLAEVRRQRQQEEQKIAAAAPSPQPVEEQKIAAVPSPPPRFEVETQESTQPCEITLDRFKQIKPGMSYSALRRLMGCDGTEVVASRFGPVQSTMYRWSGDGAQILVTVQNNRVTVKAQYGLE